MGPREAFALTSAPNMQSENKWRDKRHRPYLNILPSRVRVEPHVHVVLQGRSQTVHEGRAWCDGVAVVELTLLSFGQLHEQGKRSSKGWIVNGP
eukprot:1156804-Pelagomonas_calceolata.AAC.6